MGGVAASKPSAVEPRATCPRHTNIRFLSAASAPTDARALAPRAPAGPFPFRRPRFHKGPGVARAARARRGGSGGPVVCTLPSADCTWVRPGQARRGTGTYARCGSPLAVGVCKLTSVAWKPHMIVCEEAIGVCEAPIGDGEPAKRVCKRATSDCERANGERTFANDDIRLTNHHVRLTNGRGSGPPTSARQLQALSSAPRLASRSLLISPTSRAGSRLQGRLPLASAVKRNRRSPTFLAVSSLPHSPPVGARGRARCVVE
jgi:hypothetical protein